MANVRYSVVFGYKDVADRFIPQGEIYLRGASLEQAKIIFKSLPQDVQEGEVVVRLYERYYDKHLEPDLNYEKTEYTIETDKAGLQKILTFLTKKD